MSSIVVGIDFGTTNTCAGWYIDGSLEILQNEEGHRLTPSHFYVTTQDKIIIGHYAKRMAGAKPEYAIYEVKRLLGRRFDDPYVQNSLQYFSFFVDNANNEPVVAIERKKCSRFTVNPVKLCTEILKKIKRDTEAKIGESIEKVVITVPAYFNISQREAILSAGNQAGFTVLKLLNEPTAAALSYYLKHGKEENYSLVYDLGGGTFDVAILKRNENNVDVIGVDGNTHLGGNDFDNLILDYVCDHLQKNYKYDPKSDRRMLRRLQTECEEAKKELSFSEETVIILVGLVTNFATVKIDFTRDQFEEMAKKLFQTTIDIVDNCLKSCKLAKTDMNEVILSGGSTRIPKIQNMISEYFDGKKLNKSVDPDQCVAEGAAIQAAMLSIDAKQKIDIFKIAEVTPLSLGLADHVDLMTFVIDRNTRIPVSKTLTRTTIEDQQKSAVFRVYEGERTNGKKNRQLATFTINDITRLPPGQCDLLFTMSIDENGILKVKAKEKLRDNAKDLTITYTRGHISDKEVKNSLKDADDNKLEDEKFVRFAVLKHFVMRYCASAKYNFESKELTVIHKSLYELCKETKILAGIMDLKDEKELEKLKAEITEKCHDVIKKNNFEFMPAADYIFMSGRLQYF